MRRACRAKEESGDLVEEVGGGVAGEEGPLERELGQDAAERPDVHGRAARPPQHHLHSATLKSHIRATLMFIFRAFRSQDIGVVDFGSTSKMSGSLAYIGAD